jgi:hypothetical protein
MRIRNKISQMAFDKTMTIQELILRTITKEYYQLAKINEIQGFNKMIMESDQDSGERLLNVMKGKISNLFRYLYEINNEDN